MRIYRERIPSISRQVVEELVANELIEVESTMCEEVELDMISVLEEYRRTDRELGEQAKDLVALRNLDYSFTHKIKNRLAREKNFGMGEDAIEWLTGQMLEMLLQSRNVDEVFGEDNDLRRIIAPILKKELGMENHFDLEVKKRISNLTEGTSSYEIEYQKALDKVRNAKKLQD
jgi:hypothetical protein